MENKLAPYECQFTIEERKKITAHTLQELRKAKGYSQKEVASYIQVKPATFNTYETGRTEPPIEVLVRLSYLYQTPIDYLVQKDRQYRTATDLQTLLDEYKKELKETETSNDPSKAAIKEMLERMIDQLTDLIQKEETKDSINSDVE